MTPTVSRLSSLCLALSLAACAAPPDEPAAASAEPAAFTLDPIAAVAHGALFDEDGARLEPDREFVLAAQAYYLGLLEARADEATRAQLAEVRERLAAELAGDDSRAYLNDALIRWLADGAEDAETVAILGKSLALYAAYERLAVRPGERLAGDRATFAPVDAALAEAGAGARQGRAAPLTYAQKCQAARVPIPPAWGDPAWKLSGSLSNNQEFIFDEKQAIVYWWQSSAPRGTCIALPRKETLADGRTVYGNLGVICHGVETSKACFWDAVNVEIGASKPIGLFIQGDQPIISGGGNCTDCHAGNNPFIIHPDSPLKLTGKPGFDINNWNAVNWVDPLIIPAMPQNPGPTNALVGVTAPANGSCMDGNCHDAGSKRLLPELHAGLQFCAIIKTAMTPSKPGAPNPKKTMPPSGVVAGDFTNHINAINARCTTSKNNLCSPDNAKICAQAGGYCEKAVSTLPFRHDICRWPHVTTQAACTTTTAGMWVKSTDAFEDPWPTWLKGKPAACIIQMERLGGTVGGTLVAGMADKLVPTCAAASQDRCRARGGYCEKYKSNAGVMTELCRWPNAKTSAACSTQGGTWRTNASGFFITYPFAKRATMPNGACLATP
jgi:hypothetical protein